MAASVTVDFNANLVKFSKAIDKATADLSKFQGKADNISGSLKNTFGGLGGFVSAAAITAFVGQAMQGADALNDLAVATGTSVKALASYKLAAQLAGTDIQGLSAGLGKLSLFMANNSDEAARLGITARDPVEAFAQLADALEKISDPAQRNAQAAQVLGKSYATLMPLLAQGGDALRRQAKDQESYAENQVKMAETSGEFADSLDKLRNKGEAVLGKSMAGWVIILDAFKESFDNASKSSLSFLGGASFGVNIFNDQRDQIKDVNEELERLIYWQDLAAKVGITYDNDKRKIEALKAYREELTKAIEAEQKAANDNGSKNKAKEDVERAEELAAAAKGSAEAINRAFSLSPLDKFLDTFKDKRRALKDEFEQLRADLTGTPIEGATGSDIGAELSKGRGALQGGNAQAAQIAANRAKEMLQQLKGNGGASFEMSYYLQQIEQFENAMLDAQEQISQKAVANAEQAIIKAQQQAGNLSASMTIDEQFVSNQVKSVIDKMQQQLNDSPLEVPIIASPALGGTARNSASGASGLTVDLARAALKTGGR